MQKTETEKNNPVLQLAAQLRERTCGMCRVGTGTFGLGVRNQSPTDISIVLRCEPQQEELWGPYTKEIRISVEGMFNNQPGKRLDQDTILKLSRSDDSAARIIASALLELSQEPLKVSRNEFTDAYTVIAREQRRSELDMDRFTKEEARKISDTGWYRTKTAEEIVDFQIGRLMWCMPPEPFREALETVLGRPVSESELVDRNKLWEEYRLLQYRQEAAAFPTGEEESSLTDPSVSL